MPWARPGGRDEASVHAQQRGPLRLGELRVAEDRGFRLAQAGWAIVRLVPQDARAGERRSQRHAQGGRDGSQHSERRLVHSTLQLAEISVGDFGELSELAQRQLGGQTLRAQQRTERRELGLGRSVAHADIFALAGPARRRSGELPRAIRYRHRRIPE